MRLNYLANAIGLIMIYIGIVILSPIVVALITKDFYSIIPFITAGIISTGIGLCLRKFFPNASSVENLNDIKKTEALFIVAVSWVIFGLVSGIPYLFYGIGPVDAMFEATSGITTTGATILTTFDYPQTLFFWRSLTQWLGGLGIIVLFIAVLPQFAVAGRQMFFAEAPGPTEDKITPRIRNTASTLWGIYLIFTLIQTILLMLAGMPLFDAICNSFSTIAAGGFSPKANSTWDYHSTAITWIMTIFMFIAGSNFILWIRAFNQKKPSLFIKNEEFRLYLNLTIIFSLFIAASLIYSSGYSPFEALTHAFYQVASISTSTGSASDDFIKWDYTSQIILFIVMFMGACASSAGGGIKLTRWLIVFKTMKSEMIRILHPNAVFNVKVDNTIVPKEVIRQIIVFVFYYLAIFIIGAILISIIEQNVITGLSTSITTLGNIGPGFSQAIGPMGNFDGLHISTKIICIIYMLVGRLEIIPFLVMFQRDFWSIKES